MKYLLYSVLYILPSVFAELCGENNRCQCSETIIDCRQQKLSTFVSEELVTDKTESIYFNFNKLKKLQLLPEGAKLTYLNLADNEINEINFDAFDNLDELTTLVLSNNNISTISDDIFEWNPLKLEVLYLDGNQMEFVQHFLFYDLEKLTELHLHNNKITFVHPHAFVQLKSLRRLTLDGNKLHTFNPKWINNLAKLIGYLKLDNNPWSCDCDMMTAIEWFKDAGMTWFKDITDKYPMLCETPTLLKGKRLDVLQQTDVQSYCYKPQIDKISKSSIVPVGRDVLLGCVLIENDDHLPIATISWSAPNGDVYRLQNAYNFEGIEVHQNGSLKIYNASSSDNGDYTCTAKNSKGSHQAQTKVTVKDDSNLNDNPYAGVSHDIMIIEGTTDPPPVILVSKVDPGPENKVKEIVHKQSCPVACKCFSQRLDCAGDNNDSNLPQLRVLPSANEVPNSTLSINVAKNKIEIIRNYHFKELTHLEELRFDENEISHIESQAFFNLDNLGTLTLRQNRLTSLEAGIFKPLKKINVLVLDDNQMVRITRDMFAGLEHLNWLYFRNNHIRVIEESAFVNLLSIKFIHLEGNELTSFSITHVNDLIPLPNFKKIFLGENVFECDCMMEDIRTFKSEKDIFADGIKCKKPDKYEGMLINVIPDKLICDSGEESVSIIYQQVYPANSGQLVGGIVLGVVLAFVFVCLLRKYGRRCRCRRIPTPRIDQEARDALLPTRNYRGLDSEAYI